MKKWIARILCIVMAAGLAAGCAEKKGGMDPVQAMGRYMEREIELPKLEASQNIVSIIQNRKGKIAAFVYDNKKHKAVA